MGDAVEVLRDRAFALLVVVLALPNCLPMPPPIPLVCGFLLAFVAIQIALGRSTPWLPRIFGGYQSARTVHFFAFVVLVLFVLVHVVMVVASGFRRQMRAMTVGE